MSNNESKISSLEMEIEIEATVTEVWAALTEKIGEWWPAEFYAGGESGSRTFSIEMKPGGRMMESWQDGGGVLWGTVIGLEPNSQLQVQGSTFPAWGGPTQWFGTWNLVSSGEKTLLKFSEHAIGRVSESGMADKDKGWQFLWNNLKSHVERKTPPKWTD